MGRAIFPNQRVCAIHRWNPEEGKQRFTTSGDDLAVVNAVRRLNGRKAGGLVLWTVLRMNKDGFQVCMSPETIFRYYGIGKDCYRAGWNMLLENGFIVHQEKNRYSFYEFPEEHVKSMEIQLFKSGNCQLLKVGTSHFQNTENLTFKSGEVPLETYEEHYNNNNKDNPPISPKGGRRGEQYIPFLQERLKEAITAGKDECELAVWKLLIEIQTQYPYFAKNRPDMDVFAGLWIKIFAGSGITRETAVEAFRLHVKSKNGAYPPLPAHILENLRENECRKQIDESFEQEKSQEPEKPKRRLEMFETAEHTLIEIDITDLKIPECYRITLDGNVMDGDHVMFEETEHLKNLLVNHGIQ